MEIALAYGQSLIGTPYKFYHSGDIVSGVNAGPFWAVDAPVPPAETVRSDCCNCAGLVNLMRRSVGLSIPALAEGWEVPGGTPAWEWYLRDKAVLEPLRSDHEYPDGTLLLRSYRSPYDQGHLAVKLGSQLLESIPNKDYDPDDHSTTEIGVTLTPFHPSEYYEFVCLPQNWLTA